MSNISQLNTRQQGKEGPKRFVNLVPPEGEGGFSQSWWPICLTSEVIPGKILGVDFLGGRVIVVRQPDGAAQVLSAYCPHVGADLCVGEMLDNEIRCAFHHWRFDTAGRGVSTGVGDPIPPTAQLFKFPTVERYGVVWAFNGLEPFWELPNLFPYEEEDLYRIVEYDKNGEFPCDAWVGMANTPDWNHLIAVHRLAFDPDGVYESMTFTDHSFHYRIKGRLENGTGSEIDYDRWVLGTNTFVMYGTLDGEWFGVSNALLQTATEKSRNFYIVVVKKTGDEAADAERCKQILQVGTDMVNEDWPILETIRFKPGLLTKADRGLAKFFDYVRNYPRSNAGLDFIT